MITISTHSPFKHKSIFYFRRSDKKLRRLAQEDADKFNQEMLKCKSYVKEHFGDDFEMYDKYYGCKVDFPYATVNERFFGNLTAVLLEQIIIVFNLFLYYPFRETWSEYQTVVGDIMIYKMIFKKGKYVVVKELSAESISFGGFESIKNTVDFAKRELVRYE